MNAMTYLNNFASKKKLNSLIAYTAIENQEAIRNLTPSKSVIEKSHTNGLHMCNSLYLYTNPPPVGYGTPAPKTAETVIRAYEYNRKEIKTKKIVDWDIEDTTIHEIEDFPFNKTSGNYIPSKVRLMAEKYYTLYRASIDNSIIDTYNWLKTTKADEMSKGRQTWDPEAQRSITCAKAFSRTTEIIKMNLDIQPTTMMELIHSYIELFSLDVLKVNKRKVKEVKKMQYDATRNFRYVKAKKRLFITRHTIIGNDKIMKFLFDYSRSFCSYLKHKERGKKDRRAIASGNVIIRTFLKIIEEFHLKLSKKVPGNTIGIGGDEKKLKIATELQTNSSIDSFGSDSIIQGTEDATKWNECLTPSMFSLIHEVFFKQQISYDSKDTELNDAKKLMVKISRFTFFLMSIKRIHLGPGLLIGNDQFYNRKDWSDYTKDELNEKTWEWLSKVQISDSNYIEASPGFLMGMLNAASTTVGLLPSNFIEMTDAKIKTLRSSDDSMTVYVGKTPFALIQLLYQNYIYCKMCGINMSTKKTLFFPSGYGEYTSWYQDGEFIGQSGTETSSLRPSGINPQEDFNNIAVQTAVLMRTHVINPLGAIQRLLIGVNSVRRLYHIKEKLDGILSEGVRFLADGGRIPWVLETLLIDETAIRYRNCKTKEDFDYFYRIMNPENPFVQPPEKQFLYSRDLGSIIQTSYNVPQNIFNFVKRSNRTVNNQTSLLESEKEKAFSLAYQIAITIDPSLLLSSGSKKTMLSTYLESNMRMTLMRESCTKEEEAIIERAISKLTQVPSELDSDKGVDSDSDFWVDEH